MDFGLTPAQRDWQSRADALARALPPDAPAGEVIAAAARAEIVDARGDLLAVAAAVEAIAGESAAAALAYAVHVSVTAGVRRGRLPTFAKATVGRQPAHAREGRAEGRLKPAPTYEALLSGARAGAIVLSSEHIPHEVDGRLSGRASWVAPLTPDGLVIVGAHSGASGEIVAMLASLDDPGTSSETVETAALRGLVCGHVTFAGVPCTPLGDPYPIMACIRVLLAAAGLGMGRRALREALVAARAYDQKGAGGEQTVQGLLADAATELDAARLLTWKAASRGSADLSAGAAAKAEAGPYAPSLADASMAKLAATEATQHAVARATQVIGGDSFQHGHVIARLAQDVRALELFAGRTEALREAVAAAVLPPPLRGATRDS